ncbi:MAG: hypothetical protein SVR04_02525 [Spirochaetota bacterium]|nr:hypothetical protein [Spirochaetota bacterium]
MTWKVRELARRRIIYATRWGRDYLLSPVVVEQLPRLCSEYFTDRGEYLENPPTYAEYTASEIGGIVQIKERIIE